MPLPFELVGLAVGLFALHRLALWAESRGWIYYMKSGGGSTRAGNALLEIQQILEPSKTHVVEMKKVKKAEHDHSGDPPSTE
jgi:hypothetical protein